MMTYYKQNEHFLANETQRKTTKTNANTIISHMTSNSKQNKFNKANNLADTRLEMMKFCLVKAQTQQLEKIKEQKQQQLIQAQIGPKSSCTEQKIIRKVLKQEVANTMAQQATQHTHMTFKEYFEFSNDATATTMASNAAAQITTASATKRTNKQKCGQQQKDQKREQKSNSNKACMLTINSRKHQHELIWQPMATELETETETPAAKAIETTKTTKAIANTTDPAVMASSLPTITTLSSLSSWLSLALPTIRTTFALIPATAVGVADVDNNDDSDNNYEDDDDYADNGNVENFQSKIQTECNNVCLGSKFSSTKNCKQHKKQQQHCKSANISCSNSNTKCNHSSTQTNKNIHLTEADVASNIAAIKNTTTTNKANTIGFTTTFTDPTASVSASANTTNTNNFALTTAPTAATEQTAISTTALLQSSQAPLLTSPAANRRAAVATAVAVAAHKIPAFHLRQLLKTSKQLECLLHVACVMFFIIMSMQYQTGKQLK